MIASREGHDGVIKLLTNAARKETQIKEQEVIVEEVKKEENAPPQTQSPPQFEHLLSQIKEWYLYTDKGTQGPYTAKEIREWKSAGQVTNEWHVWRNGMTGWQKLGETEEFKS